MGLHIFSYDNDWNNTIKDIVDHNYFINLLFHQRVHTEIYFRLWNYNNLYHSHPSAANPLITKWNIENGGSFLPIRTATGKSSLPETFNGASRNNRREISVSPLETESRKFMFIQFHRSKQWQGTSAKLIFHSLCSNSFEHSRIFQTRYRFFFHNVLLPTNRYFFSPKRKMMEIHTNYD